MNRRFKTHVYEIWRTGAMLLAVLFLFWGCPAGSQKKATTPQDPKALVDEDRLVKLIQQMVRINSEFSKGVVHNHVEMAAFLEKELKTSGIEVEVVVPAEIFEAPYHQGLGVKYPGNPSDFPVVVARLRGTVGEPVVGLETHYNTVPIGDRNLWTVDPLGGEIIDGKIYGRGATNSHAGVAQRIETLRVLKESGIELEGDLVVILMPGEGASEFALPWAVANRPDLVAADWYLAGGIGPRFTKQGGHIWAKLSVIGEMRHPGFAEISAVHQMAEVLMAVIDVDRWMTWRDDPLFGDRKPYVMATVISSGDPRDVAVNVMPVRVETHLDLRLLPNQDPRQVVVEFNQLLDNLMKEDPNLTAILEVTGVQKVPEHYWDAITSEDPLVKLMLEFSREVMGDQSLEMKWGGGVGGGRPDLWNLGALVIFAGGLKLPGSGGGAHAPDEWVGIEGLVPSTQMMVDFLQRALNSGIRRVEKKRE